MTRDEILREAAKRLVEAARPTKLILFGSIARGDADEESDFDFLVVKKDARNRWDEALRLRRALRPLPLAADILVYSEAEVAEWGHLPGTALHEALVEGKVLYEAA